MVHQPVLRPGSPAAQLDRVMAFALDNYLQSPFDVAVFSSVMVYADIRSAILEAITVKEYC